MTNAIATTHETSILEAAVTMPEFKSRMLNKYTKQIFKSGLSIKKSYAQISVALSAIDFSQCYKVDGFANVHEYAKQVLGLSKTVSYNLLKLGRDYIDPKTYESVLPHPEGMDFSTSQLRAVLPLKSVDRAKQLAAAGVLQPSMSVQEIEQVVKDANAVDVVEVEAVESDETEPTAGTLSVDEIESINFVASLELGYDASGKPVIMHDGKIIGVRDAKSFIGKFMSGEVSA